MTRRTLDDVLVYNVRDGDIGGEWTLVCDTFPRHETIKFVSERYYDTHMVFHGRKVYQLLPKYEVQG